VSQPQDPYELLAQTIRRAYPHLSPDQRSRLQASLVAELALAIAAGDSLAVLQICEGTLQIQVLVVDRAGTD
jgi:hypothetical protein